MEHVPASIAPSAPAPRGQVGAAGPAMPVAPEAAESGAPKADPGTGSGAPPAATSLNGPTRAAVSLVGWSTIFKLGRRYLLPRIGVAALYLLGSVIAVSVIPVATSATFGKVSQYFKSPAPSTAGASSATKKRGPKTSQSDAPVTPTGPSQVASPAGGVPSSASTQTTKPELLRNYYTSVILLLVGTAFVFGHRYLTAYFTTRIESGLRGDVFSSLLHQSPRFFHEHDAVALTSIVNQWTSQAASGLVQLLIDPLVQSVGIVVVGVTLYQALVEAASARGGVVTYSWFAGVEAIALTSPLLVMRLGRTLQERNTAMQTQALQMMAIVAGALNNPEEVQAMRAESYFTDKYRRLLAQAVRTRLGGTVALERVNTISTVPGNLVLILLIGFGVSTVVRGSSSTATAYTVVTVGLLTPQLMSGVQGLGNVSLNARMAWPAIRSVSEVLDAHSEVPVVASARDVTILEPTIEGRSVVFSYVPGVLGNVLDDISFSLPSRQITGLVARSGAGKTTLFRSLLRFYDPQSGEPMLGGIPTQEFSLTSLRSSVALMSQESAFFHDTVRENFRVAGETLSDGEIRRTAERTELWPILTRAFGNNPLDAPFVSERISGGERKLFALTRLLTRQPSIILFDEPTVGMDAIEKMPLVNVMRDACARHGDIGRSAESLKTSV